MINLVSNNAQGKIRTKTAGNGNFNNLRGSAKERAADKLGDTADSCCIKKIINNQILASVSDYDLAALMPHFESVSLYSGEELYRAGEPCRYVYFPEDAVISHLYTLEDGNTIEIAMVGNEGASGIYGVFGSQPAAHAAQATVEGNAWRIKTEILKQEFARGGKLQTLLLDYVNTCLAQVSQRIVCESFHLIEKRLCSWLLMLQDRSNKTQLRMTQEQIALFLGVNRPSISVIAKALREKGLISYMRGKFNILDRRGLESAACECYSAVQTIH